MKTKIFLILRHIAMIVSVGWCSGVCAQSQARQLMFDIGSVEAWRLGPKAIIDHCKHQDPEGVASRLETYEAWLTKNDEMTKRVTRTVETLVPVLLPQSNPRIDPVKGVRAYITIEVLKENFLGKTPEEQKAFCQTYSPEKTVVNTEKLMKALTELESWSDRINGGAKPGE